MKITHKNDWKYEFELYKDGVLFIRFKIYDKTAEKLTSLGVKFNKIGDPFSSLVLAPETH